MKGLDAIEEIKQKFNHILKNNNDLAQLNSSLKDELAKLKNSLASKESQLIELKEKYKILKMSKKLDGVEIGESKELKLKINEMVKKWLIADELVINGKRQNSQRNVSIIDCGGEDGPYIVEIQ